MNRFRIDSQVRRAASIAQVGQESGHLRRLVENFNYSAAGLAATKPGRYRAADGHPNDLARRLERQPERIANHVYANRLGNGSVESGKGWRYRGRGLIQLIGRANYRACGAAIGAGLVSHPELVEQPEWVALSAAWFWASSGLNELADAGRFEDITRRINGGTRSAAALGAWAGWAGGVGMIGTLMERSTIYGVLAAMCFAAGWKVNGWRLGEGIAQEQIQASSRNSRRLRMKREGKVTTNLKIYGVQLIALGLLLQGCGSKPVGSPLSSLPAMPELPASARQGQTPPQCLPTCLERWNKKAAQWQKRLASPAAQGLPASGFMME